MFENKKYKNTVFLIQNKFYKLKNNFVIITAYNPMDNLLKKKKTRRKIAFCTTL